VISDRNDFTQRGIFFAFKMPEKSRFLLEIMYRGGVMLRRILSAEVLLRDYIQRDYFRVLRAFPALQLRAFYASVL